MSKKLLLGITMLLFAVLLLSACSVPPVQAVEPLSTQPTAAPSEAPSQPAKPSSSASGEITPDLAGVAQDQTIEKFAAKPARPDGPWMEAVPEHTLVTLQGYPIDQHLMKPQIFIYPVAALPSYNEAAGKMAADLQALLQSQQPGENLPFMPLFNAGQVMHTHMQYLDFKSGKGVRFLTQFDQAPLPINSFELFYTFQGLTSDGKYYIAAVLPVTHSELPDTDQVSAQQAEALQDFPAYLAQTVSWLDQQPDNSFTPDLAKLDALIQSIEVK